MRKRLIYWMICLLLPTLSFGQKKKDKGYFMLKKDHIVVDGDIQEWQTDFLNASNTLWNGAVALSGNKLYAAAVIKDSSLVEEVLKYGMLLNLSYNHKEKDGAQLFFPAVDRERLRALEQQREQGGPSDRKQVLLNSVRGYYIRGFSKVIDGLLSFENDYGIHAVAKLDPAAGLIYEVVVPLDLIKFEEKQIAVQLAVNTTYMQLSKSAKNTVANRSTAAVYGGYRPTTPQLKDPYPERTSIWVVGDIN